MSTDDLLAISIPLAAVGALLAAVGQAIGEALGPSREGWRGTWHRTRALHPILVGAVLGLSDMPVPEAMGAGLTARLVWYGLAGALAIPIYEWLRRSLDRRAR